MTRIQQWSSELLRFFGCDVEALKEYYRRVVMDVWSSSFDEAEYNSRRYYFGPGFIGFIEAVRTLSKKQIGTFEAFWAYFGIPARGDPSLTGTPTPGRNMFEPFQYLCNEIVLRMWVEDGNYPAILPPRKWLFENGFREFFTARQLAEHARFMARVEAETTKYTVNVAEPYYCSGCANRHLLCGHCGMYLNIHLKCECCGRVFVEPNPFNPFAG